MSRPLKISAFIVSAIGQIACLFAFAWWSLATSFNGPYEGGFIGIAVYIVIGIVFMGFLLIGYRVVVDKKSEVRKEHE